MRDEYEKLKLKEQEILDNFSSEKILEALNEKIDELNAEAKSLKVYSDARI